MAWVTFTDYKSKYLLGRTAVFDKDTFPYWEKQACTTINVNKVTLGKEEITENLRDCVCEVAEYLFTRSKANQLGSVKSFSNDGYSETFTDDRKTPLQEQTEIRGIVYKYLANTELHNSFVFSGVR